MNSSSSRTPEFDYDPHGDVLYISLGRDDEPYYCENVDDMFLVQRHMETDEVTGFQIVGVKEHGVENVQVEIRRVMQQELERAKQDSRTFKNMLKKMGRANLEDLVHA